MKLQVTLALIGMLFPKVPALQCYQCLPGLNGACTQKNCPDKCGSLTLYMSVGQQLIDVKDCAVDSECVTGSLNMGHFKITVNTKCCSTDLCNSQKVPALPPPQSPNGRNCYTCTDDDCTGTVSCMGDEDQCISVKVNSGGTQVTAKGCVSRSLCNGDMSSLQAMGITGSVSCCSGNLCNSAEGGNNSAAGGNNSAAGGNNSAAGCNNSAAGVKMSLLIMLVPLLPSIFFLFA